MREEKELTDEMVKAQVKKHLLNKIDEYFSSKDFHNLLTYVIEHEVKKLLDGDTKLWANTSHSRIGSYMKIEEFIKEETQNVIREKVLGQFEINTIVKRKDDAEGKS